MRRSLQTLAAGLQQIVKSQQPAPSWSLAWLGLPHASTSAPYCSAGDGREASNSKGKKQHPRKGPNKPKLTALAPHQDHAPSKQSPQGLQRMLSSFPAKLTRAHVHSVLAWAIDHFEQQFATRGWQGKVQRGIALRSPALPQTVDMPMRQGRGAQATAQLPYLEPKEPDLMEDILRDFVHKLDGFQQWNQHLLQACNNLATHPAAPPHVRTHATTLTAAAVRQVLMDRKWGFHTVQGMATLVSNSLATLSRDREPQRHAAILRDALDSLQDLIPPMNVVPSWRTALVLSQLGLPHIPTFKAIAFRLQKVPWKEGRNPCPLDNFSPKELALLGHAFASAGARSEGLFDLMSQVLEHKLDQVNSKDISMLTWALCRLDLKSSPLLSTLASAVNHLASTAAAVPQLPVTAPPSPPPIPVSQGSSGGHQYSPANSSALPTPLAAEERVRPQPSLSNPLAMAQVRLPLSNSSATTQELQECAQQLPSIDTLEAAQERNCRKLPTFPPDLLQTARLCLKLRSGHARPLAEALCNVGAAAMAGNAQMAPCDADEAPHHRRFCAQDRGAEYQGTHRQVAQSQNAQYQGSKLLHAWQSQGAQGGEGVQQPQEGLLGGTSRLGLGGSEAQLQGGTVLHAWQRREVQGGEGKQHKGLSGGTSRLGLGSLEEGILEPWQIVLLLSTAVFYRVHNPELLSRGLQALGNCPPHQVAQQLQLHQMVHLLWVLSQTSANPTSPSAPHSMQSKLHLRTDLEAGLRTEGFKQPHTQGADPPCTEDMLSHSYAPVGLSSSHPEADGVVNRQLSMDFEEQHGWQGHARGAAGGEGTTGKRMHAQLLQVLLERLQATHGHLSPFLACIAVQALAALGFRDHSLVSQLIRTIPGASPPSPHSVQSHPPPSSAQSNPMRTRHGSSTADPQTSRDGRNMLNNCGSSSPRDSHIDRSTSSSGSNEGSAKSAQSCSSSISSSSTTTTTDANASNSKSEPSQGGTWEDLTPSMAIRTLCALAELQHRDQGAVRWLAQRALQGVPGRPPLKPPQLPYLTWALAKLQAMDPVAWQSLVVNIASSTCASNACQAWQPHQLTQVMWALGEAYPGDGLTHVPGWDRAVRGVLQAVEDQLPRFTSRQLLLVMHGVARVRCSLPALPVVDYIALQASRCVARGAYSLDDLLVLLWSSVVAGHANHTLYDAIAEALLPAVDDLQLGGATLAAWCYLRHANYLHPTLTERLLHHCTVLLERGNTQAAEPRWPLPGNWGVDVGSEGEGGYSKHMEHPNLGRQGSLECSLYGPFHRRHQQGGPSFDFSTPQQQQQQHHSNHRHQQQAMQAQKLRAEGCSAVILLTLAASFARCQSTFTGVGALFAGVAARAARMQQHGPLDAAEHEALTHLMAMLGHPHAATSADPCSLLQLPLLSSAGTSTTTTSDKRVEQTAYPALPLSLRLTPAFEEGGMGWMERGGGGGIGSWGSEEEGRIYI